MSWTQFTVPDGRYPFVFKDRISGAVYIEFEVQAVGVTVFGQMPLHNIYVRGKGQLLSMKTLESQVNGFGCCWVLFSGVSVPLIPIASGGRAKSGPLSGDA